MTACSSQPFMIFMIFTLRGGSCHSFVLGELVHLQDPDLGDEISNDLGPAGQALSETMIRGGWAPWTWKGNRGSDEGSCLRWFLVDINLDVRGKHFWNRDDVFFPTEVESSSSLSPKILYNQ